MDKNMTLKRIHMIIQSLSSHQITIIPNRILIDDTISINRIKDFLQIKSFLQTKSFSIIKSFPQFYDKDFSDTELLNILDKNF